MLPGGVLYHGLSQQHFVVLRLLLIPKLKDSLPENAKYNLKRKHAAPSFFPFRLFE